jgi:hypothetical protein
MSQTSTNGDPTAICGEGQSVRINIIVRILDYTQESVQHNGVTAEPFRQDQTRRNKMSDVRVLCVNKQPRQDPHHGITHLGGDGWKRTRDDVVRSIEARTNTFYTLVNGTRADVGVVNGPNGKFVRTHADGKWTDNLLALPECIA